jgi:hypothetical protein
MRVAAARVGRCGRNNMANPISEHAMETKFAEQIALLKDQCVPKEFLSRLFGVSWPPQGDFTTDFATWEKVRVKKQACAGACVSRWIAETFLQDHRLLPLPWAAARLGMMHHSLQELLPRLNEIGLRRAYAVYSGLIDESLAEDLIGSLRGLRFRTFGTHDSFCEILHTALNDALGVKIDPCYCATSIAMDEYPRLFANHIDCIKLEPLSVKHSLWLDLGKPLNLPPDRFSKLFYVRHRDELLPLIAGRGEPARLEMYARFLQGTGGSVHG